MLEWNHQIKGGIESMSKYEKKVYGKFSSIVNYLHEAVMSGSASSSYEDGSDYQDGDYQMALRVYERYSWTGANRVSLTLVVAGSHQEYWVTAITSGGSQGMFMKVKTLGESSFLETIVKAIDQL